MLAIYFLFFIFLVRKVFLGFLGRSVGSVGLVVTQFFHQTNGFGILITGIIADCLRLVLQPIAVRFF